MSRALLLALALLAGCSRPAVLPAVDDTAAAAPPPVAATVPPPVVEALVAEQPLPELVETVSPTLTTPLYAVQEAVAEVTPVLPPPEPANAACRRAAAALIVRWEVSSPAYYDRHLRGVIWPRGQSGLTWGIGYDGGHQSRATILADWEEHAAAERLATTAGITGEAARRILSQYTGVVTEFEYASRVFEERSLIEYERRAERAFKVDMAEVSPAVCAVLLDLVYNRGGSMTGDSRREMKAIRDVCLPDNAACIAREVRSMCRLWRGTVNGNGLCARRESEALLLETS